MNRMEELRFRQVHLDFHTSEAIPGIGEAFDPTEWAQTLKTAHVNSVTCFSCCHHGWSYHPTRIGAIHPHLKFNLLRAQLDAAHAAGIRVPVYLTAGNNQRLAMLHPEWREITPEGRYMGWEPNPLKPGFAKLCFNSGYLDVLRGLVEETVELFPDADGIFLDIICQSQCCCPACLTDMLQEGFDPEREADRIRFSQRTLTRYYEQITAACRKFDPGMPVFHNSGHIDRGNHDILKFFSHLELESLPTGGWGYDHFPMSAAHCRKLPFDFLGMTGKFHNTWGEFGGFKHPDALRYECMAMLANNAKCSIGDQLHPDGRLDSSTYRLIGEAYAEVEKKEPFCRKATSAARIAILSNAAFGTSSGASHADESAAEVGAARILLEGHLPFDILDAGMEFGNYDLLILADDIRCDEPLTARLTAYLDAGGKLLLSGESGLAQAGTGFVLKIGADDLGESEFDPCYQLMNQSFAPEWLSSPMVMYGRPRKIRAHVGSEVLGDVLNPYFQRSFRHFSSHQHTPFDPMPTQQASGVLSPQIAYFAFPVFGIYRKRGQVALKIFILNVLNRLMSDRIQIHCNLPAAARLTLMRQERERRTILHLLYAPTVLKGGGATAIEVIEELPPTPPAEVKLLLPQEIESIFLEPEHRKIPFTMDDGKICFTIPPFRCHQMAVLNECANTGFPL